VQPVDPLNLWHRPPFSPSSPITPTDEDHRGARRQDDKGQLMTFRRNLPRLKSVTGSLPVDVTIVIEGEEEVGSKNFVPFLEQNKAELKADFRAGVRHRHVGFRHAGGHDLAARLVYDESRSRPPIATCIPASSAAARKIRFGC
jgi:hypothetical protein